MVRGYSETGVSRVTTTTTGPSFIARDRTIPVPNEIDQKLHLLAGWDLRRLVSEIYGAVDNARCSKCIQLAA